MERSYVFLQQLALLVLRIRDEQALVSKRMALHVGARLSLRMKALC